MTNTAFMRDCRYLERLKSLLWKFSTFEKVPVGTK